MRLARIRASDKWHYTDYTLGDSGIITSTIVNAAMLEVCLFQGLFFRWNYTPVEIHGLLKNLE